MKQNLPKKYMIIGILAVVILVLGIITIVYANKEKNDLPVAVTDDNEIGTIAEEVAEPQEPTESEEPIESEEAVESLKPVEPTKPTKPMKMIESVKPTEPEKTIESAKVIETVNPIEPEEPEYSIEWFEPMRPEDSAEPEESIEPEEPIEPENPSEADIYYRDNAVEVIQVMDAKTSGDVPTETEVTDILTNRGFDDYSITYEFSIDGEYNDATEVSVDSANKHPMYQTYYVSESGDVWTVFVINGDLFANPVSFNLESDLGAQVLFSESRELTSYDDETNKFYVTIPKESAVIVKVVDKIDMETLNKLTLEEIKKL